MSIEPGRVIVDLGDASAGPTLIGVGSVHGNEPAGAEALGRVARTVAQDPPLLHGRLLALAGHLTAIETDRRFIERDLNRIWSPATVQRVLAAPPEQRSADEAQLAKLHEIVTQAIEAAGDRPLYFIDLHTTSAHSAPFVVINDTLACRDFALAIPVPIILGLEEHVSGTLPDFALSRGCIALGFEAGQHDDPASVDNHEAAIWLALAAAGILDRESCPACGDAERRLRSAAERLPRFVEIIHRHPITDRARFEMKPGFENFAHVRGRQLLARDDGAELIAPRASLIFMPLYQELGDDGFFLVKPVSRFWLWLSRQLRCSGTPHLAHWLPGVRRGPGDSRTLHVDPRIARFLRTRVLHLLGYRRIGAENGREVYRRRD